MAGPPLGKLAITLPAPFHDASACVALARRAEDEWGYDAIWFAETNGPDSFSLAGAVAQATSRVTLGTGIVPVYNRTPAVLAMGAGTLSQLSEGRFILGLGSSSHAIIGDWNGIAFEQPLAQVRETVAIVRQALAGQKTDFEGTRLRSQGLRLGSLPGEPTPIYLAALREKMLRLAGEIGDGLVVNFFPVTALPQILAAYREGAAGAGPEGSGRDARADEVVCRFQVAVTDDVPAARALVRAAFGGYLATPVYNRFLAWCGFEAEARNIAAGYAARDRVATGAAMHDDLIDRITILGDAASCREQVAGFVAAGVTTPVIAPLATSREAVLRVFEAFAPALLP